MIISYCELLLLKTIEAQFKISLPQALCQAFSLNIFDFISPTKYMLPSTTRQ